MIVAQVVDRPDDFPVPVLRKKRLQQVLLIPEANCIGQEMLWVIPGRKYVMNLNNNALAEKREQFQVFKQHIPLRPDNMRGVDKQYVIHLKLSE
jgi:hypothetical protein